MSEKVVKVPAREAKPKIRLMAMVPTAPMRRESRPPMRSVRRPLISCPVPYARDQMASMSVIWDVVKWNSAIMPGVANRKLYLHM